MLIINDTFKCIVSIQGDHSDMCEKHLFIFWKKIYEIKFDKEIYEIYFLLNWAKIFTRFSLLFGLLQHSER